jgi:hypothetical protein
MTHTATLFRNGATRGKSLVGKTYGAFVVDSHVGGRDDSLYVNLKCTKCGAIHPVKRDQLSQKRTATRCNDCPIPSTSNSSHMRRMTEARMGVLAAIRSSVEASGQPPTVAELMATLGIKSRNSIDKHLKKLARDGHITQEHNVPRGIRLAGRTAAE